MRLKLFVSNLNLINGLKQGQYFDDKISSIHYDSIWVKSSYMNDRRHGEKIVYKNGFIYMKYNYVNDKIHGQRISYLNGSIRERINYVNGEKHGLYVLYYPSGKIETSGLL